MKKFAALLAAVAVSTALLMALAPAASPHVVTNGHETCGSTYGVQSVVGYEHDGYIAWVASGDGWLESRCLGPRVSGSISGLLTVVRQTFGGPDTCLFFPMSDSDGSITVDFPSSSAKNDAICQGFHYPNGLTTTQLSTTGQGHTSTTSVTH